MNSEMQKQLEENIFKVRSNMEEAARRSGRKASDIILIGVSKTKPSDMVKVASGLDIDAFGENKVQEIVQKSGDLAYGERPVHMIGHLQTNKVRSVIGLASMIQSVDSLHLAEEIAKRARAAGIRQDILLEINIGGEESKFGVKKPDVFSLVESVSQLESIKIRGIMSIPPVASQSGQNRPYFESLRQLFVDIKNKKYDNVFMDYLSMGMSNDFTDAILEGSNMIRVGTAIFGAR